MVLIIRPGSRRVIVDGVAHELTCAPTATHAPYELLRLLGQGVRHDAHSMTIEVRSPSGCATVATGEVTER